jgi:hypothetical protein
MTRVKPAFFRDTAFRRDAMRCILFHCLLLMSLSYTQRAAPVSRSRILHVAADVVRNNKNCGAK